MAEQEKPVRRRVALKLIKAGHDSKEVVARFEAERQALAMMDHHNIAKVLDGGTTETGQPYFVMELVQGIPFNKYCDQHKLSINERLELFVPICNAVQHAHQKGIIHRDLKPSNILVSLYDGKPVPKVIDFGLAKALQHQSKLTDKTLFTEFGQVVGTLQYMSPEQAEMNQLDVDTRTDIYSLGVILYELLTGSTPIDADTLKNQAIFKVLESIREKEPPRPSARLSSSTNEAVSGISLQRQIDPGKLKYILRGELDWIVMKALEKDRSRRYETAIGFGEDVKHFINGDAVEAKPPSAAYRVEKFVKKNRGLVASIVSIATLLMLGIVVSTVLGLAAKVAATRAAQSAQHALAEKAIADEAKRQAEQARRVAVANTERAMKAETLAEEEARRAIQSKEETEETLARYNVFFAQARWNEGRVSDAFDLLHSIPKKHRKIEWGLSNRQFEGSDMTLYGHQQGVLGVAFSPDGSRILSGSFDKTIKLWDALTGSEIMTLMGHDHWVLSVAFSPDGSRILSGSFDKTIKLWDALTGSEIMTLKGHDEGVNSVGFSPDGSRILSGSSDCMIKLWDAHTGSEIMTLKGHDEGVNSVAFSPDGARILSGSEDKSIKLWDAHKGSVIRELEDYSIRSVAFSPDGSRILSGSDHSIIKLWDTGTGSKIMTLKGHNSRVNSVAFSPDGSRILSGSFDNTIKLWDARTGSGVMKLNGHNSRVNSVAFSHDGSRILSGSDDKSIKLWDARTCSEIMTLRGHVSDVNSVTFSPDGSRILSGSSDDTIKLWNARGGAEIMTLKGHDHSVRSVAFSPDGSRILSGSWDSTIKLWDAHTGIEIMTLRGHDSGVRSVAFSPDGLRILSSSMDEKIKLWDAVTGSEIMTLTEHNRSSFWSVAFSPDGSRILSGADHGGIKLWDARTGAEIMTLQGHVSNVNSVTFSPDGSRILSGSSDNTIKLWDARTGSEIMTLIKSEVGSKVGSVAFSPDGSCILWGAWDKTIKLLDARTSSEIMTLKGHVGGVNSVTFSPDGSRILSWAWDKNVKLWDAGTGSEIITLKTHDDRIMSVAFSPDGRSIFSQTKDYGGKSEYFVWDVATGNRSIVERPPEWSDELKIRHGNFIVTPVGNRIVVVDNSCAANDEVLHGYRKAKSRLDPLWHREQAELGESKQDHYSMMFHRVWLLNFQKNNALAFYRLKSAHAKWLASFQTQAKKSESGSDVPAENFVSQTVREAIELPQGTDLMESDAIESNSLFWEAVKSKDAELPMPIELLELATEKHPTGAIINTLGVTYYRLRRYQQAIDTLNRSLPLNMKDRNKNIASPSDVAFLALSHLKLDNKDEATNYKNMFEEAMKDESNAKNKDHQSFHREINDAFEH